MVVGLCGSVPLLEGAAAARRLHDARQGLFNVLVIYKVDRLGRDVIVTLTALREIHALGVTIISATETLDLSTPAGWAMAAVISAFGQLERENFLSRSKEATDRLAREGVWLGGIIPFGYRVEGKDKEARLVISDEPIPGQLLSEGDVIRLIYRMLAEEHLSCFRIADHLNALGIPPAYARDGRLLLKGKRKERTQGIWRAGRIRNMVVNTTYKGVHGYGKRSKQKREVIERPVPAIVSEQQWQKAQEALRANMICSMKNAKHFYLLRGLMQCGICGLNYSGTSYQKVKGEATYYTCNGKLAHRVIYGSTGTRCTAKAVQGTFENLVWEDIQGFICNPGDVLKQLERPQDDRAGHAERLRKELSGLQQSIKAKTVEAGNVVALCRKGLIDEAMLEAQLQQVKQEETVLQRELQAMVEQAAHLEIAGGRHRVAEDLLQELRTRMAEPITWEMKRRLVECLVKSIRVDTVEEHGQKRAIIHVLYGFDNSTPAANRRDTGSCSQSVESAPGTTATARLWQL